MKFETQYNLNDLVYTTDGRGPAVIDQIQIASIFDDDKFKWSHEIYYRLDSVNDDEFITCTKDEITKEKPIPKSTRHLEPGDEFYVIVKRNFVEKRIYNFDSYKDTAVLMGDAFVTEEEALREIKRRMIHGQLREMAGGYKFETGKENIYIGYDCLEKQIFVDNAKNTFMAGTIYFETWNAVCHAIDRIGEDKLIHDYFGIDDREEE